MKNGAVVHGARDEVELQRVVDKLGVEIVFGGSVGRRDRLGGSEAPQDRPELRRSISRGLL